VDSFVDNDHRGWTSNVAGELRTTTCGILGEMLGGYDVLGRGAWVEKVYDLRGQMHSSVDISLTFVKIDSWDGERGIVLVDGREIWSRAFAVGEGSQHCGQVNGWDERDVRVGPVTVVHSADTLALRVTSTLNQDAADESFAISDVLLEVHSSCLRGVCTPDASGGGHSCTCDSAAWSGARCDTPAPSGCGTSYVNGFVGGSLDGWSSSVGVDVLATMTCGGLGEILGGYNILGAGAWLEKAFDLSESPHLTATVSLTFVKIDSWDGERAMVLVDGNEVWADSFGWEDTGTQHCGRQEDNWHEVDHEVGPLLVSHFADTLTLRVTTTLDQQAGDESFGIANVAVSTGPQCGHGTCIESGSDGAATPSCSCQFGWSGDGCSVAVLGECQGASPSAGFVQDRFDGGDIRGWSSSIAQNLGTTHCGALGELLGGFGLLGSGDWLEKTYADLPTHSSVSLQLVFVKVDSWDGERGIVLVDGREIWSRAFVVREGSQHCGGELGWHERDYQVGPLSIDHVARSLTLRVTTTLNQGAQDESFGISDVLIEVLC
jgi:hypothetical protein